MIKVLLVEDELFVRSMVRTMLDFDSYGYHICGECSDGQDAVRLIEQIKPNIVMTDIRMNRMNGDKLVEHIYKNHPEICTIVLSAYGEFNYVRNTMRNNAVDYLIKSDLNKEILLESLEKARGRLSIEPEIKRSNNNLDELRRKFVVKLIAGLYKDEEESVTSDMRMLDLHFETQSVWAVIMMIDNYRKTSEDMPLENRLLLEYSVCNVVNEVLLPDQKGLICHLEGAKFVLLVSFGHSVGNQGNQNLSNLLQQISFCLSKYLNLSVSFSIGPSEPLLQVGKSYQTAEKQWEETFLHEKNTMIYHNAFLTKAPNVIPEGLRSEDEIAIEQGIRAADFEAITGVLNDIFTKIKKEKCSREAYSVLFDDLIIIILTNYKKCNIMLSQVCGCSTPLNEYVKSLETLESCRTFFEDAFCRLVSAQKELNGDKSCSVHIKKALAYLRKHYKEEISLTDVAEKTGINSSYFSTRFKSEVGVGFTEYLSSLRMEEAKRLMENGNCSMKKIMELCGFNNYSSFFTSFKKKYGVNPQQYMKEKN